MLVHECMYEVICGVGVGGVAFANYCLCKCIHRDFQASIHCLCFLIPSVLSKSNGIWIDPCMYIVLYAH